MRAMAPIRTPPPSMSSIPPSGRSLMSTSRSGRATPSRTRSISVVPPARKALAGSSATVAIAPPTSCRRRYLSGRIAHLADRGPDVGIGRAAADVAAHELRDVLVGRRVALLDQLDRGHDLARCAVTALQGVVLNEGALHGMQLAVVGEALDRRDLAAL